ncbi:SrtB family sortase [Cohnella endophytica]|uniref:SrtB family sortase n=1 Tax=Cohnella endophytica TaxID=2419778 RepID=A0A494XR07_9BACL|nr:class B sortase [Cohnella endophytica]RKP53070.1 SrtB family sortase [Cohnella endophytica]
MRVNISEKTIRTSMLVAGAIVLSFALYKIGAYEKDSYVSKKTYADLRDVYYEQSLDRVAYPSALNAKAGALTGLPTPVHKAKPEFNAKFSDLVKVNEDIVGWVKIEGTRIDYPVAQGEDNEFYLNNDINRKSNVAGSIFMDYRNELGGENRNVILYGHDMKNKTMFADLVSYESRWNFENKATIEFDTLYGDGKWVIFSAYTTDISFDYLRTDFQSDEDYQLFLDTIKAKSLHRSDVQVSAKDSILTLSTCSSAYKDARFVVHAKRLDPN